MPALLRRLAAACTHHPRVVLTAWLVLVAGILIVSSGATSKTGGDATIPGTDSARAAALLSASFPDDNASASPLVLHARHGALSPSTAEAVAKRVSGAPSVAQAEAAQLSKDKTTQVVSVRLSTDPTNLTEADANKILDEARAAAGPSVQVEAAGAIGQKLSRPSDKRSEIIGLIAALIVLLFVNGTVPTMLLPIVTALVGLIVSLRILALVGSATSLPTAAVTLATMIGLGVGIDYALFLLSRMRAFRADGEKTDVAVQRAIATTGSAILFAASTVTLALCALAVAGLSPVTKLGAAAAISVVCALLAALTLLPALVALLGERTERLSVRKHRSADESPLWRRWGEAVAHRPWQALIASLVILLVLAAPTTTLMLGSQRPSDEPTSATSRRAYDLLAHAFGPGSAGPVTVVASLDPPATSPNDQRLTGLQSALEQTTDVAAVSAPRISQDGKAVALTVTPKSEPGSDATSTLVHHLRDDVLPTALPHDVAHVGGSAALPVDLASQIASALPLIIGVVVALSIVLLLFAFRSVVIPLKAAAANLFSVAAAYGVLTAVFQHGWGASLIGLPGAVPVVSYVPMIMFAVLFGLSMDYEVFLLSRVQEHHHAGDSDHDSIVRGLASTGRLITARR